MGRQFKNVGFIILSVTMALFMWAVYSIDRALTCWSLQPKPGFSRWLNTPRMKMVLPEWLGGETVEHNLQILAFIRVGLFLIFVAIW